MSITLKGCEMDTGLDIGGYQLTAEEIKGNVVSDKTGVVLINGITVEEYRESVKARERHNLDRAGVAFGWDEYISGG